MLSGFDIGACAKRLAKSSRAAIDTSNNLGDAATADLFVEIVRGLDKGLWFLEAHLQSA